MRTFVRLTAVCVLTLSILSVILHFRHESSASKISTSKQDKLTIHEWGTFTSIAGKNGMALDWRPLNGSSDLPKFVHTIASGDEGLRHGPKADMVAAVRMETPVLYFYADREMSISAQVDFPKGKITEWYPQARTVAAGINWGEIKITPGAAFNLPVDYSNNHYYAARETDAAPIQVCGTNGKPAEQEKFLFYRGVGTFNLPVAVTLNKKSITLRNSDKEAIAQAIVFENRDGKIGFQTLYNLVGAMTIERPALDQSVDAVVQQLRLALIGSGLYEKEADAMIKTWRNSWFEPGMRVFYILPRHTTDAVLPIKIDPQPNDLVRVLVGRTEVITPEMEKSVEKQVRLLNSSSAAVREQARVDIEKYGRFSEPILKELIATERDSALRTRLRQLIQVPPSE